MLKSTHEPRHDLSELVALALSGELYGAYVDCSDEVRIRIVAQLNGRRESREREVFLQSLRLLGRLGSLDLASARTLFRVFADSPDILWNLSIEAIGRLMERQPAGTFDDVELRRLFRKIRRGESMHRKVEGLEVTRRIQLAIGDPEANGAPSASASDRPVSKRLADTWIDTWIATWEQLVAEVRAAGASIDATLRERSRKAQRIAAAHPDVLLGRRLMNLDEEAGEACFRAELLSFHTQHKEFRTFDRAWLAQRRRQEAAWQAFGPMLDWSGSKIPGIAALSAIRVSPEQTLTDVLFSLRTPKPNEKWLKSARALTSGRQGPRIRRTIADFLSGLSVSGSVDARARLWKGVSEYRNFRRSVLEDTQALSDLGARDASLAMDSAVAAALIAFFDYWSPHEIHDFGHSRFFDRDPDPSALSEVAALLVRGAVWMLACWRDAEAITVLQRTAQLTLLKPAYLYSGAQQRSLLAANACVLALGEIATPEAVQALGRIKLATRDERLSKQIAKAMELAASRAQMSVTDLEEIAVPTFDLDEVGRKTVGLGEIAAMLRIESSSAVTVLLTRADGAAINTPPASIKADPAADASLKRLRANAKAIAQTLPVHRQRIESLYLTRRTWPLAAWRERFLDHPLIGTLARRLIWTITGSDGHARSLMWHGDHLVDATDAAARNLTDDCVVSLWHPIEAGNDEDAARWRAFLMRHRIVQPFKQAHRELYPITDAERTTGTYSNRFAGHILRQHQSVALGRRRGWRATLRIVDVHKDDQPTHLRIPDFDLAAELWTEAAGDTDENDMARGHPFISTDRVRFRRWYANGNDALGDPVPLHIIPARVFSEVMRDVDLFVGVASIGNDPTWIDGGADGTHASRWRDTEAHEYWTRHSVAELDVAGQSRKAFLSELIPSLAIADRCTLTDRFLEVRGRLRTYRIHLGSGNILTDGNRYLCIVPTSDGKNALDAFLPFEGDRMLSVILSKAVMLADDDRITEPSIVSQLRM